MSYDVSKTKDVAMLCAFICGVMEHLHIRNSLVQISAAENAVRKLHINGNTGKPC